MSQRQKITQFNGLSGWLSNSASESQNGRYVHRILKEEPSQRAAILDGLKYLVQKAHEDARLRLRKLAGDSLDPFGDSPARDPAEGYPERLHIQTLKGYFGEVFAGIIAENIFPFGQDNWEIPAFLFRFHIVEFQHLEFIHQVEVESNKRPGRTGDDCLAFQRNSEGSIIRSLVCEAKCTASHNADMISQAHEKASEANLKPIDIPQLIEILQDYNDPVSAQWINALRNLWLRDVDPNYERCDLVSYICGQHPVRRSTWIPTDKPHDRYTGGRRLEAVEIHLHDVEDIVKAVYGQQDNTKLSQGISTQTVKELTDLEKIKANSEVVVNMEGLQDDSTK